MHPHRLFWQLFISFLLIPVFCLLAVTAYTSREFRQFFEERTRSNLEENARLLAKQITPELMQGDLTELQDLISQAGQLASARFTVILPLGRVVADSHEDPTRMDNHASRPEIQRALAGRVGDSTRFSNTVQADMSYVAIPLEGPDSALAGVLRAAVPLTAISDAMRSVQVNMILAVIIAILAAAIVSAGISRRISRPLEELRHGARRFAQGDFSQKLHSEGSVEIQSLTQAMNQMARQLDERFQKIIDQQNELEAVFSSMKEGVLAVDQEGT
ncbi:HAMP domain-containing protein, partial [bacterium]|nr:HAMP domain-containing protein [bacterium]